MIFYDIEDKPYYDNQYTTRITISSNSSKDVILYPNRFNISSWNTSLELWNKGNSVTTVNNNLVYKTIYSPSPTNYLEPRTATYTGFTTTGVWTNKFTQFNISGIFTKGWNFYCFPNFNGATIFVSALGYYSSNSNFLDKVTTSGYYWTAGPSTVSNSHDFDFYSGAVSPQGEYTRTFGLTIQPTFE